MVKSDEIVGKVKEMVEEAKKRGYPYAAGWMSSTITSVILGYVPVASRQELMNELQESINYLIEDEKKMVYTFFNIIMLTIPVGFAMIAIMSDGE